LHQRDGLCRVIKKPAFDLLPRKTGNATAGAFFQLLSTERPALGVNDLHKHNHLPKESP
jgi:hypothetical protein